MIAINIHKMSVKLQYRDWLPTVFCIVTIIYGMYQNLVRNWHADFRKFCEQVRKPNTPLGVPLFNVKRCSILVWHGLSIIVTFAAIVKIVFATPWAPPSWSLNSRETYVRSPFRGISTKFPNLALCEQRWDVTRARAKAKLRSGMSVHSRA